jgi:hypothetical protein
MCDDGVGKTLLEAERQIEAAADGLRLLSLPRDEALFHLLTVFEDRSRIGTYLNRRADYSLPGIGELANLKYALKSLVPRIFLRCVQTDSWQPCLSWASYELAKDALEFGMRYSFAEGAYRQWFNRRYEARVDGRRITFAGPESVRGDRDAVGLLLSRHSEERHAKEVLPQLQRRPPTLPELAESVRRSATKTGETTIAYHVDSTMLESAEASAAVGLPPPRVHPDSTNGLYTVAQAREVWRQLAMRAHWHTLYCLLSGVIGMTGMAVGSVVEVLEPERLRAEISFRSQLPADTIHVVLSDLAYPPQDMHADVRMYPLIHTKSGLVLVAPHLFITANWETLLLRLWARGYSGEYGKSVAWRKRELARTFAVLFERRGWLVSCNKPLRDDQEREIGDVDLAVASPEEKLVAIFEIKWLIPPDDVPEVTRADEEITKGIGQARRARDFARRHPDKFLAQVFRGRRLPADGYRFLSFVVSQGHAGSQHIDFGDTPVLDFELSEEFLCENPDQPLEQLCGNMAGLLDQPVAGRDYVATHDAFRLAGYEIAVPVVARPGYVPPPALHRVGRNDRCPCGSGRKFKRCCDF